MPKADIEKLIANTEKINLAADMDEDSLEMLGKEVFELYEIDKESRSHWEEQMANAMKLMTQFPEKKTVPWENASNVKFPLITTAAIQFNARAGSAIIPGKKVVKSKVTGADPDGKKMKKADRRSAHLNYQLLEEQDEWADCMDKLLIRLPIIGTDFKKTYFDFTDRIVRSDAVSAANLVVNIKAKSLKRARKTEHVFLYPNEILERQNSGVFLDSVDIDWDKESQTTEPEMEMDGDEVNEEMYDPQGTVLFLEQHWRFDLDEDEYPEPYIVTIHAGTRAVVRIVAGYDLEDIAVKFRDQIFELDDLLAQLGEGFNPEVHFKQMELMKVEAYQYYTKYTLLPAPDNNFYELGLGRLLEPINESINTSINQMFDAGTLANAGGGFVKGLRKRSGPIKFRVGEWQPVEGVMADNVNQMFFPIPAPGANATLFNLLTFLIDAGRDISSVKDILMGDIPAGDVPATTTLAAIEQGMKLFTGIYQRIHRSLKEEVEKIIRLNRKHLTQEEYMAVLDDPEAIKAIDYSKDVTDVQPVSDPTIISETQKMLKAQDLLQFSGDPLVNQVVIRRRYFEAVDQPNIEELMQVPEQGPPPELMLEMQKLQLEVQKTQQEFMIKIAELRLKGMKTEADAIESMANAEAKEAGIQIDAYKAQVEKLKAEQSGGSNGKTEASK